MEKKLLAIIVLVMVASLSVAGCTIGLPSTSSPTPTPPADYSSFYDNIYPNRVLEKPFNKTISERGNDLYVGVIRNASQKYTYTITLEHVRSQDEAASVYKDTVAGAIREGYVARSYNTPISDVYPVPRERWQGDKSLSYMNVKYYYYPEVNSWVVEKQYV
jgi:hypothetical protein